jgi:hypothetical protein
MDGLVDVVVEVPHLAGVEVPAGVDQAGHGGGLIRRQAATAA